MAALDVEQLVSAHMKSASNQCQTCRWLDTRPDDERAKWDKVLADPKRWPHAAIFRAIAAADPDNKLRPGKGSVEGHRGSGHRR